MENCGCGGSRARSSVAGWLAEFVGPQNEFITVTMVADFSIFSPFVNSRAPVPMVHPPVTLGASSACLDRPHFDPGGSD